MPLDSKSFFLMFFLAVLFLPNAWAGDPDELAAAIRKADQQSVKKLLRGGVLATVPDSAGFAPLVNAVLLAANREGVDSALRISKLLLLAGARVDQEGPPGNAPLSVASSQTSSIAVVQFLIANNACIDCKGYNGTFALYHAVRKRNSDIAELLIKSGANLDMKNDAGVTALHYAALNGMFRTVALLISRGADVNARDSEGRSPLAWALGKIPTDFISSSTEQSEIIDLLRQHGGSE